MRRILLLIAATLFLPATGTADAQQDRPHILVVTVDDMNADSMSSYGCPLKGITPNMDALVRSGMHVLDSGCHGGQAFSNT